MEKTRERGRGLRILKAFLYSTVLFLLLTGLAGLLLRFTPLPETGSPYLMIAILTVSCLFLGLCVGSAMKKGGLLYGGLCALLFLLAVLLGNAWFLGSLQGLELFQLKYLLCLLGGAAGGVAGVHLGG
ncbi:MAG: TIGR04086 family membrane protein [Bacillota bacterium]|nr:TIGR04086 family membrane protein [Bacillota bacterium]